MQTPSQSYQTQGLGQHPGFSNPLFSAGNAGLGSAFGGAGSLGGGNNSLASHAAQMGFEHGAELQRQQARGAVGMDAHDSKGLNSRVREVWKSNLHQEMAHLRDLVDRYKYVSMVSLDNKRRYLVVNSLENRTRSFLA
jgi:CCR4-NOT transcription complex subunit 7/8